MGTGVWGIDTWGGGDLPKGYDNAWPRTHGSAFQIRLDETSSAVRTAANLPNSPVVGAWALYDLHRLQPSRPDPGSPMPANYTAFKVATLETPRTPSSTASSPRSERPEQHRRHRGHGLRGRQIFTLAQLLRSGAAPGQVPTWTAAGWVPTNVGSTRYVKTTPIEFSSNDAMNDLLNNEIQIGAGVLSPTGAIHLTCGGDLKNDSNHDQTIDLKLALGSTSIWESGLSDPIADATLRRAWVFKATIQSIPPGGTTGASDDQQASGLFALSGSNAVTTGTGALVKSASDQQFAPFMGAESGST